MGCCVIFCAAEFDALARPLEKTTTSSPPTAA